MTTHKISSICGSDVSNRTRAAEIRTAIVNSGLPAVIDFEGVRVVSDSFADELIAVIVVEHGEEWFRHNIRVINLSPINRQTVLQAIRDRQCATA